MKGDEIPIYSTEDSKPIVIDMYKEGNDEESVKDGKVLNEDTKVKLNLLPPGTNLMNTLNRHEVQVKVEPMDQDVELEDFEPVGVARPRIRGYNQCTLQNTHMANLGMHYAYAAAEEIFGDPRSYDEAIQSPDAEKWQQAAQEEYQSLMKNGTW
jgi:hypothetical protein